MHAETETETWAATETRPGLYPVRVPSSMPPELEVSDAMSGALDHLVSYHRSTACHRPSTCL